MVKSVAVIGAGAAGAVTAAALKAEDYFDVIKVFERRHTPGGTWIFDPDPGQLPLNPGALPPETDPPLDIPSSLPCNAKPSAQERFDITPIYEDLETNVPDIAMSFTDLPFAYGPFAPHHVPKQYIENYFSAHGTDGFLRLGTTVEDLSKLEGDRWRLVLRKRDPARRIDQWWEEEFDAVVLANGHYSVPYIPAVSGLPEFMKKFPARVEHSKTYRTAAAYEGQNVLIIGNSASGLDIVHHLLASPSVNKPIHVSRRSRAPWDKDQPGKIWKPVITEFRTDGSIVFEDETVLTNVDKVIYCTGYKASYPFWNERNNGRLLYDYKADRLIKSYQHTFSQDFPTLAFIGLPRVLTFRSFEYQAIAVARLWSGRNKSPLPPPPEQQAWERDRAELTCAAKRKFHDISWDNGETMEWFGWLYQFAGLPQLEGPGRCPPVLGPKTRWAIEHTRKYLFRGTKPPLEKAENGLGHDWLIVNAEDKAHDVSLKDSLHFI